MENRAVKVEGARARYMKSSGRASIANKINNRCKPSWPLRQFFLEVGVNRVGDSKTGIS